MIKFFTVILISFLFQSCGFAAKEFAGWTGAGHEGCHDGVIYLSKLKEIIRKFEQDHASCGEEKSLEWMIEDAQRKLDKIEPADFGGDEWLILTTIIYALKQAVLESTGEPFHQTC